jgi:hypothetical protein
MCKRRNYILSFILMLIVSANFYAQVDPGTKNLTNSWTFNDGTAKDYIGGADGTLKGGAKISNGVLQTSAGASWLELPASKIAINKYNAITIEAWFKSLANANTGFCMLAYFGDTKSTVGVNYYFITAARGDDKSRAAISCGSESSPWAAETGADGPEFDDGKIHHMVSTLDAKQITLYIDGEISGSKNLDTNNSIAKISPTFTYLAKSGYDADSTWKGEILEFNIFNKALSASEVQFLFNKGATPTGIKDRTSVLPGEFNLSQNYPNPFNPTTTIRYSIGKEGHVKLSVYDVLGNIVAQLVNETKSAGSYSATFNADRLSTGVYFSVIESGNFKAVNKMILMK